MLRQQVGDGAYAGADKRRDPSVRGSDRRREAPLMTDEDSGTQIYSVVLNDEEQPPRTLTTACPVPSPDRYSALRKPRHPATRW
jgi:hypothetical protein